MLQVLFLFSVQTAIVTRWLNVRFVEEHHTVQLSVSAKTGLRTRMSA